VTRGYALRPSCLAGACDGIGKAGWSCRRKLRMKQSKERRSVVMHGGQLQVGASARSAGSTWNSTTAPLLSMYRSVDGDSRSTTPSYSSVGGSPSLSQYSPSKRSEISGPHPGVIGWTIGNAVSKVVVAEVVNGVGAEDDAGVGEVGVGPTVEAWASGTREVSAASTLLAEAAPSLDPALGVSESHAQTRRMVDSRTEHLTTLGRSRSRRGSASAPPARVARSGAPKQARSRAQINEREIGSYGLRLG
jgi:hypothetical protein